MPKQLRKPAYQLHKASGQGKVRIGGKDFYLGLYGTPESRERYNELVAEWLIRQDTSRCRLTVDDLVVLYLDHAQQHYRKDGKETSEVHCIRLALNHLIAVHGRTRVRDFGPRALKEVRQAMIDADYVRGSINLHVGRIRTMFRWAVENEYCPVEVWQALRAVPGLRAGRTEARESEPVRPVDDATVERTLAHLPRVVADMVRLQLLTGARPGEICAMRPRDVERGGKVWTYRPVSHKTEHHGKERRIYIGPEGQRVLAPYLLRDADSFCFQPAESETKRNSARKEQRRSAVTPSQASRKPKGRELRDH